MRSEVKLPTEQELLKKHPTLRVEKVDPFKTEKSFYAYEGFGIECGKGWYGIIDRLFTKIEEELRKEGIPYKDFQVSQIKEKFARLVVYSYGGTNKIEEFKDEAEKESTKTCELCGYPGRTIELKGWLTCLCSKCLQEELNRWKEDILESMSRTEKQITIFSTKKMPLNTEELQEFEESKEWMKNGEKILDEIEKIHKSSLN